MCILSSSMSRNWNGTRTDSYGSSRGLRQGDPISPDLVMLALERMGHRIHDLLNNGS